MSDSHEPHTHESQQPSGEAPYVMPVRYAPTPPPAKQSSVLGTVFRLFCIMVLAGSLGINVIMFIMLMMMGSFAPSTSSYLPERFHSGEAAATDKIAVVRIDGVLMEGMIGYAINQINAAAADPNVKAVVLRINSPGGSITASDDLHRRIVELRDGLNDRQKGGKKTVIVSMGSMAASGGYYIAAPSEWIVAETTTITGSIGVYAAFPNVEGLAKELGFTMNVIKAGDIKNSGSMFHKMSDEERLLWQDMVDNAYARFIDVVETGRPELKGKMKEIVFSKQVEVPVKEEESGDNGKVVAGNGNGKTRTVKYVRRRADGGIFTAQEAKKYDLINEIGYLKAAIAKAHGLAAEKGNISTDYRVIMYDRPPTLANMLFGVKSGEGSMQLNGDNLAGVATPRMWYITPQAELAGLMKILGK